MKEGDIIIASLQQADGIIKNRPGVFLRHEVSGFDEIVANGDTDFVSSRLSTESLIRLGYLLTIPKNMVQGKIGSISTERHRRLLERLSEYLIK